MEGIVPQVRCSAKERLETGLLSVRGAKTDSLPDHFESAQWSRPYGTAKALGVGRSTVYEVRPTIP